MSRMVRSESGGWCFATSIIRYKSAEHTLSAAPEASVSDNVCGIVDYVAHKHFMAVAPYSISLQRIAHNFLWNAVLSLSSYGCNVASVTKYPFADKPLCLLHTLSKPLEAHWGLMAVYNTDDNIGSIIHSHCQKSCTPSFRIAVDGLTAACKGRTNYTVKLPGKTIWLSGWLFK
jgi:hypothetical protein